ncbi:hypothetical protein EYF80_061344 [Liparis tanakae]|uniref:Uncharacterized protein n=1 Tax=Liparis tanakae TaxID=230148 RepID=A0A4Z2EID7_9TELE|nr:hypothetical protein EYF80_061344 [Liparis tanakae]
MDGDQNGSTIGRFGSDSSRAHVSLSMHSTTFPKAPCPRVNTTSSGGGHRDVVVMKTAGRPTSFFNLMGDEAGVIGQVALFLVLAALSRGTLLHSFIIIIIRGIDSAVDKKSRLEPRRVVAGQIVSLTDDTNR